MKIFKNMVIISLFFFFDISFAAHNKKRTINTLANANASLHSIISNFSSKAADRALTAYKQEHTDALLQSAKILYDSACQQTLEALAEIDSRIAYWQYQKDHPWNYFVSKNPLKWVTGPAQEDELKDNLETLKSHQGELYVFLGQLGQLGNDFKAGYKDAFISDPEQGDAWIDRLLDALIRIKTRNQTKNDGAFITRARQLQEKLQNASRFKDELLSDISATAIPPYVARNWFKGGMAMLVMGYGYKNAYDSVVSALAYGRKKGTEYIIEPVTTTMKDIFYPGRAGGMVNNDTFSKVRSTTFDIAKNFVYNKGEVYGISAEDQRNIVENLEKENYEPYQHFLDNIANQEHISPSEKSEWTARKMYQDLKSGLVKLNDLNDYVQGKIHFYELFSLNLIASQQRQYAAVGKLVLLIPAVIVGGVLYSGYQKLTQKKYSPLRHALIDINSLFVDPTKQLTDEERGKMTYLIYMLKKRAKKELPTKRNVRDDFIKDLERIESSTVNVAAKRAIIEDMFRKYEFLGLIQKK